MARFVTRVELHNATSVDFDNLHLFMAQARFHRTIWGDDGVEYQLPTATYYSHGDLTPQDVRTLAKIAADRTGRVSWVLVTQEQMSCWELMPVHRASLAPNALSSVLASMFPSEHATSPLTPMTNHLTESLGLAPASPFNALLSPSRRTLLGG